MNRLRISLMSLIALIFLTGPGIVQGAGTAIRFNAALNTPYISVSIGNTHSGPYRIYGRGYLPVRVLRPCRIIEQDRMIAHRLARFTGVPARELIRLRRRGYTWFEIGRWLHLPRPVVQAAMHHRSWKLFLRRERPHARRGTYRDARRRTVCSVDCYGD